VHVRPRHLAEEARLGRALGAQQRRREVVDQLLADVGLEGSLRVGDLEDGHGDLLGRI
jgi:hypothetical protein